MSKHAVYKLDDPAYSLSAVSSSFKDPLVLFPISAVIDECHQLWSAIHSNWSAEELTSQSDIDDSEWGELMHDFSLCFGPMCESDKFAQWLDDLAYEEAQAIAIQLNRVIQALHYAEQSVDDTGSATGLLLSPSFVHRFLTLVGKAVVPVVWLHNLDVLKFETGNVPDPKRC